MKVRIVTHPKTKAPRLSTTSDDQNVQFLRANGRVQMVRKLSGELFEIVETELRLININQFAIEKFVEKDAIQLGCGLI
jgi:hypothetical protein